MSLPELITRRLRENITIKEEILSDAETIGVIETIAWAMTQCLRNRRRVYFFGNGGSAADAQHLAAEIVSKFYRERIGMPAEALSTNTSIITAIANDYSFEKIFARQLDASGLKGDIAFGISTSGNSSNVLEAISVARQKGMITIGFTGQDGGRLKDMVDHCFRVPSNDTPRIQEIHITVGHILCEIVEREIFGA